MELERPIRQPVFWALLVLFLALETYFVHNWQWSRAITVLAIPPALGILWLAVRHFEQYFFAMVFLIPISINIRDVGGGIGFSFPSEGLILLAGLLILLKKIHDRKLPFALLTHPVSLLILVQLLWIAFCIGTSTFAVVSFKLLLARMLYLLVFYLFLGEVSLAPSQSFRFLTTLLLGLVPAMLYADTWLVSHAVERRYSPEMARPFFDDHTLYGAVIAMLLPAAWLLWWNRKRLSSAALPHRWTGAILLLLAVSLYFSFSRAAWLSIILAIGFLFLLRLGLRFRLLFAGLILLFGGIWTQRDSIYDRMLENQAVSGENIVEIAQSVTNVSSDESNQERLNRWSSALAMHQERPWMGFGPGTYERNYAGYQAMSQKTRISTNDGDRGDAHSEYLTALAEQGIPGLALLVLFVLAILRTGMRAYHRHHSLEERVLVLAALLGMTTYFIHGFVNDFLDLDKAAPLFWGMSALIVTSEIRSRQTKKPLLSQK